MVYALVNHRIGKVLDEFSLADLADPKWLRETAKAFTSELASISSGD